MSDESEIHSVLESVAETFGSLDVAGWLANFHNPCMIGGRAVDPTESRETFAPLMESMRARGLTKSRLDSEKIQVLTPASAIATATFTRFAGESVLERLGATYVLQKRDGRWLILLVTSHSPDISVVRESS
ncbi:MAG: nuclear transport factor 2 family protein [Dehalococcoidia bacterium]